MGLPHVVNDQTLNIAGVKKQAFDFFKDPVVPGKLDAMHWVLILTVNRRADLLHEIHLT